MILRTQQRRSAPLCAASAALLMALAGNNTFAQPPQGGAGGGRGGPPPAPLTPKAMAPEDLSGYWVSVVTEDWRFRMVTPAKGDFASVPLSGPGRAMANTWDPDKDIAAGQQCKSYGAAGLMRVPGRIHITWPDESTIKMETDAGEQTRIVPFQCACARRMKNLRCRVIRWQPGMVLRLAAARHADRCGRVPRRS